MKKKTMVGIVYMPSRLWLGYPSQMGGVDIGFNLQWLAVLWVGQWWQVIEEVVHMCQAVILKLS